MDPIQDHLEYDPRSGQYQYNPRLSSWPMPNPNGSSPLSLNSDITSKRSTTPLPVSFESNTYHHTATYPTSSISTTPPIIMDQHRTQQASQQQSPQQQQQWTSMPQQPPVSYPLDTAFTQQAYAATYDTSIQTSPTEYANHHQHIPAMDHAAYQTSLQANFNAAIAGTLGGGMAMNDPYTTMAFTDTMTAGLNAPMDYPAPFSWSSEITNFYGYDQQTLLPTQHFQQQPMGSPVAPSETHLSETLSLHNWEYVDHPEHPAAIFNPQQTLHPRALSDSSSDNEHSRSSLDGYVDCAHSISSPSGESAGELAYSDQDYHIEPERELPRLNPLNVSARPMLIQRPRSETQGSSSPPQRSPVSPGSRGGRPRKSTATSKAGPASKGVAKKTGSTSSKDGEKRVGKRKGPLREDQRKQASAIRKLGACIRCRFLKKTCDTGAPCSGCQPSHARLWTVPCTRIDIKHLDYFVKDWRADYERHVSLGFSVGNIKGFGDQETTLWITHGYGQYLPVPAREVQVRDDRVFGLDWVEADEHGVISAHEVVTARMAIGKQGITNSQVSDYLDRHIDNGFPELLDEYFQGSPFFPEILKVIHRYYMRETEKTPAIRKALKFLLAYNFTHAVTLIKPLGEEQERLDGTIPEESQYHGNIAAPCMINFQVKCAMAEQWRALQSEVLEELSHLYTKCYTKDKLKHWPTIFIITVILLIVWEEMQFDCRYRVPDENVVEKFCKEMVDTPVGVVVGLFSAVSTKIPSFLEWDTAKHQESLNSDPSVCKAMEEVRDQIKLDEAHLRSRSTTTANFDRSDFDCLSNMFTSKLVIRAH